MTAMRNESRRSPISIGPLRAAWGNATAFWADHAWVRIAAWYGLVFLATVSVCLIAARGCRVRAVAGQAGRSACSPPASGDPSTPGLSGQGGLHSLLEAIIAYESVHETVLFGDGGKSKGPAHIQIAYWVDSGRRAEDYERLVFDRDETKRAMVDYFRRYEPEALARGDWESLARLHNGGPRWRKKPMTAEYWRRVKAEMKREG